MVAKVENGPAMVGSVVEKLEVPSEATRSPAQLLAMLEARVKVAQKSNKKPTSRLRVNQISQMPELFQPRDMDERHVQELVRAVGANGDLSPVEVIIIGNAVFLIDGHHRIAAYQEAKILTPIPVTYFSGSVKDAVIRGGSANSQVKLPMTTQQRLNAAWRYVTMDCYSKQQVHLCTGASLGTIGNMHRVRTILKKQGEAIDGYSSWWQAFQQAEGRERIDMTHDENEARIQAMVEGWADVMSKAFGNKLSLNADLAARVFEIYFGRKIDELADQLKHHIPDESEYEPFCF